MKVLITGGLGHIGSQLIRDMAAWKNVELIRILDNLSTQRYVSLFNLPKEGNYEFIEGDILDEETLNKSVEGVDAVIHLAAITNAEYSFAIKDEVLRVNLEGAKQTVAACQKAGVRQILFPSTTSVYGPRSGVAFEDCSRDELNPQSPYAEAKLQAEDFILGASRGDFQATVFRFGTIFGPSIGMRFHTAVNKFIFLACLGRPLTVWEQALHQQRPYLDLRDGLNALRFALENPRKVAGERFNVVTLNATVAEIIEAIKKQIPDVEIQFTKSAILNQHSYSVDGAKLISRGFAYQGNLQQGIASTISLLRALIRQSDLKMIG